MSASVSGQAHRHRPSLGTDNTKKKKKNKKVNDTGQKKDQSQLPPVRSTDTAAPQTAGISGGKEGVDTAVEHRKLSSED